MNPNSTCISQETDPLIHFFLILRSEHLCLLESTTVSSSRRAVRDISCHSAWSFFQGDMSASQLLLHWWSSGEDPSPAPSSPACLLWFHVSFPPALGVGGLTPTSCSLCAFSLELKSLTSSALRFASCEPVGGEP